MANAYLWAFLPIGYLFSVVVEGVILGLALSRWHPWRHRLFAAVWLTAATYPVVILVLPTLFPAPEQRWLYLICAETFAPLAECLLFRLAFHRECQVPISSQWRDYGAIVVANLASFGVGELLTYYEFWDHWLIAE